MTPDIEGYAPFLRAVFENPDTDTAKIPFTIADRHPRRSSGFIDAFLSLLEMRDHTLPVTDVLTRLETGAALAIWADSADPSACTNVVWPRAFTGATTAPTVNRWGCPMNRKTHGASGSTACWATPCSPRATPFAKASCLCLVWRRHRHCGGRVGRIYWSTAAAFRRPTGHPHPRAVGGLAGIKCARTVFPSGPHRVQRRATGTKSFQSNSVR